MCAVRRLPRRPRVRDGSSLRVVTRSTVLAERGQTAHRVRAHCPATLCQLLSGVSIVAVAAGFDQAATVLAVQPLDADDVRVKWRVGVGRVDQTRVTLGAVQRISVLLGHVVDIHNDHPNPHESRPNGGGSGYRALVITISESGRTLIAVSVIAALGLALSIMWTRYNSHDHIDKCRARHGVVFATENEMYGHCEVGGVTVDKW